MTYGLWLSTAGLQANEYRMSVTANNLANADTVGFKRDLALIRERNVESTSPGHARFRHPILDQQTGGAFVAPTVHTFEQGTLEQTNGRLDTAIQGQGFFAVDDGGETRYTRDGRMTVNENGELIMVAGQGRYRVLDDAGQAIRIDREQGELNIAQDGTLWQGRDEVAKLGLVEFDDTSQLTKRGANIYQNHGATPTPSTAKVKNGFVERSTADPIRGMTQMIEVSRAYQLNANLLSLQDQTIGQAVTTVGRIG